MKLNKTMGRVATTLVATAMLASVAVVPAFAEEVGQFKGSTFNIQKHLQLEQNTFAPNVTFTFNVSVPTAGNQPITTEEQSKGIEAGVDGAIDVSKTATIAANAIATKDGVVTVPSDTFTVDVTKFSHAGVYKYVVTESSVENDDFKYDSNVLILYVHVKNDDTAATDLAVSMIELVDPDGANEGTEATKIDGFTNEYGKDNDDTDKLYDITLNKVVTGDQANLDAKFKFMVGVDSEYDNDTVLIVDTNGNGIYGDTIDVNGEPVADDVKTLPANGTAQEIWLGNGVSAKIFNLTDGATYTVTESEGGQAGYVTTVDKGHVFNEGTYTVTGSVSADDTITYTNTKTSVTPTGIVMNVAPYALLVVVAAAGCFVFMRKRRED